MKKLKIKKAKLFTYAVVLLVLIGIVSWYLPSQRAVAAAPGCSSSRPTAITGSVVAYGGSYNNWSVNVLVGMDLHNAKGQKVNPAGGVIAGGYSATDAVNPTLAPPGAASGHDRTFGANASTGVLCVSSSVTRAYFEVYPKTTGGITQKTYYGGANDQNMVVKPGATNRYSLRIPTSRTYSGNTGNINGYVNYRGKGISAGNLRFRVFPTSFGTACGVQGFSAGADYVGTPTSKNTFYRISNIAGGQCGAAHQTYNMTVSCINNACGGNKSKMISVRVANGKTPRVDVGF